jgi:hypothetical protein
VPRSGVQQDPDQQPNPWFMIGAGVDKRLEDLDLLLVLKGTLIWTAALCYPTGRTDVEFQRPNSFDL